MQVFSTANTKTEACRTIRDEIFTKYITQDMFAIRGYEVRTPATK
jgi:hypothetical protein